MHPALWNTAETIRVLQSPFLRLQRHLITLTLLKGNCLSFRNSAVSRMRFCLKGDRRGKALEAEAPTPKLPAHRYVFLLHPSQ